MTAIAYSAHVGRIQTRKKSRDLRSFPEIESINDAQQAWTEAKDGFHQAVDMEQMPVEVIDHLIRMDKIIGGLVELNVIEFKKNVFRNK
jgi:hypothetical protein